MALAGKSKDAKGLALLGEGLSFEPYAIALPRGDWQMRLDCQYGASADLSQWRDRGNLRPLFRLDRAARSLDRSNVLVRCTAGVRIVSAATRCGRPDCAR